MWWRKKRRPAVERPLAEPLEPRILYAADLAAGLVPAGMADPQGVPEGIEIRMLDSAGEYASTAAVQADLTATPPPDPASATVAPQRGRLALNFETNVGQAAAGTDFIARASGVDITLADGNATLTLKDGAQSNVVGMTLLGASPGIPGQAEGDITARTNYLVGSADQWLRNVENHASVRYAGVYDGIDLRYYGKERLLEYDFIVAAGADARQIALHFDGVDGLSIDSNGALVLSIAGADGSAREIRFDAPVSYQEGPDGREAVASRYVIGTDGNVRFEIGAHDSARALVIDPVLAYGTYFGGIGAEGANAIAVDSTGAVYLAGYTASGSLLGNLLGLRGGDDIFVTKLASDLSSTVYTTYLGGTGDERANAIAVNASGDAYVTGWTRSSSGLGGFPTVSAYQGTLSGTQDAFVMKLSADGSALEYATYLGGSGSADVGNGIAVDAGGNAYVVGTTTTADFPTTPGAADGTLAGSEAFVSKLNSVGSALVYSTFLGGSGSETGNAIAIDNASGAYVAGSTNSGDFPVKSGDYQSTLGGGYDAFVVKLNSAGTNIGIGTYFGGSGNDTATALTLRTDGSIAFGGDTTSVNLPTTSGALQAARSGSADGYVAVLGVGAGSLAYSTYLGGSGAGETVKALAADSSGRIYAVGNTDSSDFAVSASAVQGSYSGGADAFVTLLDPSQSGAASLAYGSYLGGSGQDNARAAAFASDRLYVAGDTTSAGNIATAGASDTSYGGSTDAFAAAFSIAAGLVANTAPAITSNGGGATATISVVENDTAVTTVAAADTDLPAQTLTYSISGGADAARFTINPGSGVLSFVAAPNFETPADADANNVYELIVQVSDGTLTDTQAISVTVTNVNEAPAGSNTAVTINEDAAHTFSAADFGFSDTGDSPANALLAVKMTTLPGAGLLTHNGAAVSAGQTITLADINLGRLVFTPVANANGAAYASFTFQVQDDGGTANGGVDLDASPNTITINVTAVNDAPVLTGANNLIAINEDLASASNNGTLVSALIAGMLTEADSAAVSGIAVTAVDNTHGAWQYTTNGGGAWTAFGAPSDSVARLLAANASTSVRFVPDAHWNGTVATGITFRAWDQTTGAAGSTADAGTNGGTTAYSSATASAGITVNPVNDAPAGADRTVTTNEDAAYTFSAADFGFTDPNDTPGDTLGAVRINVLPGAGTLTNNGIPVSANQIVTLAEINLGHLVFAPARDASGAGFASFTFQVRDNGGTADGGANLDASPNTITVDVTAINDAPVNTGPGAQATAYNVPLVFSGTNGNPLSVADVDAGATSVHVTLSATNGTLALAGVAGLTFTAGTNGAASMAFAGTLASINAALNGLTFTPTTNFSGAATISLLSDDLGNSGAGGPQSDSDTVAVTVNPPTALNIVGDGFAATEDAALNATSVLGNDSDPALGLMSVTAVNGSGAALGGAIVLGSGARLSMHADGTFTYDPNGAFESLAQGSSATDSFTYTVSSTSGGSGSGTAVITIAGANDAPLLGGVNNLIDIDEDHGGNSGTLVSALIAGHMSDADSAAAAGIAVIAVDDTHGTWQYTTNGGTNWTAFGAPATSAARLLAADASTSVRFVPNINWNGTVAGGIRFMAWDQTSGVAGGTADTATNGGSSAFSSGTVSANITVHSVSDAPAGADRTVTTNEDIAYTFTAADFGFSDTADSPANILSAVRIANLPGAGTLSNNGVTVSAGQTITATDINLGRLVFTPGSNANGAAYASFTFQVQDDGGTANGGIDLDASPNTITINVTALNDAPAGTNTTVTTREDSAYIFSAVNFGFSDSGDSPANALLAIKMTTLPGAGSLTHNGAAVSAGQTITLADINLGRVVFTPVANANGAAYASFTFQVQDDGGTANGGVDLDASPNTITINVTAVNDAPAGVDRNLTLLEDSAHTFGAADFAFSDSADSPANAWRAVRIATLPGAGVLTLNGSAVTVGQTISAANIAAGRLVFTPAQDGGGNAYASFTFQVQDDGGTADGGVDLDASPNTITVNVTAVNDAPVGADTGVDFLSGVSYVFVSSDFTLADTRDAPADALSAVIIDSLPTAGILSLDGTAVTAGQVVSATDIAAARLVFAPTGATAASFSYRVRDSGGTANGGADTAVVAHTMRLALTTPPAAATDAMADALPAASMAPAAPPATPAATTTPPTTPATTTSAPPAAPAGAGSATDDGGAGLSGSATPAGSLMDAPLLQLAARAALGSDATGSLPPDPRPETSLSGERKAYSFESTTLIDSILTPTGRSEATRVSFDQFLTSLRSQGFIEELDRLRDEAKHEFDLEKSFAVTATGVTFGLSVAYVLWLVRSGVLMGSLLSSLPAWRVLDPLPVLAREGEVDEDDDEFDEPPPDDADHPLQPSRGY